MENDIDDGGNQGKHRITVEAPSVSGILTALEIELVEQDPSIDPTEQPGDLTEVLGTIADVYGGVLEATDADSRGRSRKMVRQYAGREDLSSGDVGHVLRVLEAHDLVAQDGNRWRVAETDAD